jgi:limonene-1,2-epoxide hydrolase
MAFPVPVTDRRLYRTRISSTAANQNEYIGVFGFVDGKITLWLEYANPEASHAAIAKFADDAPAVHV